MIVVVLYFFFFYFVELRDYGWAGIKLFNEHHLMKFLLRIMVFWLIDLESSLHLVCLVSSNLVPSILQFNALRGDGCRDFIIVYYSHVIFLLKKLRRGRGGGGCINVSPICSMTFCMEIVEK